MSSTTLEQLRSEQENIETLERHIVAVLGEKSRNHRGRVLHGHKVSNLLDEVVQRSQHVKELYDDKDNTFADEMENMKGRAVFTSFYEQLKSIRNFHKKYPNANVRHEPDVQSALNPQVNFSGEEHFGKYVDLHEFYLRFINLEIYKQYHQDPASMDYLAYLLKLNDFSSLPQTQKLASNEYKTYLVDLKVYLLDFYRRTQPLVDLEEVLEETKNKFEKDWALNQVANWNNEATVSNEHNENYCVACKKQFSSSGVYQGHLKGKKHRRNEEEMKKSGETSTESSASDAKDVAFNEILIRRLYELLTEVIHATVAYLEVKQTRTHEELQAEAEEEEAGAFSDVDEENHEDADEDEDAIIQNPLNLPLGWDGKPIPYWLYKLHGLGTEFKCEICGNHSYWGRRNFDRHFQEWRHAFGMRRLQIPNTKHFHDITLIKDAIELYAKLKDQIDGENWKAENEEEFEDSEGNVLTRKTYEDLARQGLL